MNKIPIDAGRIDHAGVPHAPRKSIGRRTLAVLVVLALLILLAMDGARTVGRYMPFAVERNVAANYLAELPRPDAYANALNAFAERIAAVQGLSPEIAVEVHVLPSDNVQAFATLGGHILIYKGLLGAIKSEDELAALLAHQIAHLGKRHPAQALGRRVSVGMMLSLVSQDWAEAFARPSFHSSLRTAPTYLEAHETATIEDTGATLFSLYGHLGGASDLARTLRRLLSEQTSGELRIIETHPGIQLLDEQMQRLSQEHGWPLNHNESKRRPLPAELRLDAPAPAATAPSESAPPSAGAQASPSEPAPAPAPAR